MRHLPNFLTLCNLFCGCVAIAYLLTAQPYLYINMAQSGSASWIFATEQFYYGSIFIGLAGVFDMLDGAAARGLQIYSPIGKYLDSLADLVSFGVAPSMVLFRMLWDALQQDKGALDVSMIGMVPAFLVACSAALRLAKFSANPANAGSYFDGMPTPAVGLFVGAFPAMIWFSHDRITELLHNKWVLYGIIALVCYLMHSPIRFFKLLPAKKNFRTLLPTLILLLIAGLTCFLIKLSAVPLIFIAYIVISIFVKHKEESPTN
ncbi:MAG: CDP-alcohol phosphatidyltransferase [Chitinophagia bacterium]|nr:CDP-alcohol phosphatidyltransferase [Chitinophagia bacterium]